MHMMFVDESGDPGYPPRGRWSGWGGSTHFARAGVIIHGWRWQAWNNALVQFKKAAGLAWDAEIKASDIRRGSGCFAGWPQAQRTRFLEDLLQLVGNSVDITLIGVLIDKQRVVTTKSARLANPSVRSLELLLERYNLFLRNQTDRSGIVILDPVKEKSDDNLRHFQSFLMAKSANMSPLHIVEGAFFAKSHTSNMVQIADVCSNVFYREHTRHAGSTEFALIKPRFWTLAGRLQGRGIKTWP